MKRLLVIVGAGALLVALSGGPALAQGTATATVNVTITVLPYAKVAFDQETLDIDLGEGNTGGTFYAGATLSCNCDVTLTAAVEKPTDATGTWTAQAQLNWADPGVFYSATLLEISISGETPGYGTFLTLLDGTLVTELPTLEAGQATITVMQMP